MNQTQIDKALNSLQNHGITPVRKLRNFSFGSKEQCKEIFINIFKSVDQTKPFQFLPEYEEVVDWMSDTKGKGLWLHGDCGRGKSVIITGIIPVLFTTVENAYRQATIVNPIQAKEMNSDPTPDKKYIVKSKALDKLLISSINCIDELGTELKESNYGEPFEPFCKVIDSAEAKLKLLFVSTNLNNTMFVERYGERALDREQRLCKVVEFKGESLR